MCEPFSVESANGTLPFNVDEIFVELHSVPGTVLTFQDITVSTIS